MCLWYLTLFGDGVQTTHTCLSFVRRSLVCSIDMFTGLCCWRWCLDVWLRVSTTMHCNLHTYTVSFELGLHAIATVWLMDIMAINDRVLDVSSTVLAALAMLLE